MPQLPRIRRWLADDGLENVAAPYYRRRRTGSTDPLAFLLRQRLTHPTRLRADEVITSSWDNWQFPPWKEYAWTLSFTGTRAPVGGPPDYTISITAGGTGYRDGPWDPGGPTATGTQLARNPTSKLGPKSFGWTMPGNALVTVDGVTRPSEPMVLNLSGEMAVNADTWDWTADATDEFPASNLSGSGAWDEWETIILSGADAWTADGLSYSYTGSLTVSLTAI